MSELNINGLVEDICVSFGLPLIFLLLALVNIKVSSRRNSAVRFRWCLLYAVVLFIVLICTLTFQDRAILRMIWQSAPVVYSLLYSLFVCIVIAGVSALIYWKLRPEMWRRSKLPE